LSDFLRVPFSVPDLDEREVEAVAEVLRSGWLTSGPQVAAFENEFRDYIGGNPSIAVSSCTTGLHVSLTALGVGPGDEVITTPLTFAGTVQAIEETGARAVLADIGADLNLDPGAIAAAITPRTRAILPVHIAGKPCMMDEIWALAERHKLFVVEDAAHAAGSEYRSKKIGAGQSDATVFSFYATKNLTTGEGGMVTANNSTLAQRVRLMANHGIQRPAGRQSWQYRVIERGFKYNLSDIQAAIGRCQLRKLEQGIAARTRIAGQYRQLLESCAALELPPESADGRHAWHLYIIRLNFDDLEISRDEFTAELARRGVGASVHFTPIPLHPYYRDRFPDHASLAETMRQFPRLISLPMFPGLTSAQVEHVAASVRAILESSRRRRVATLASVPEEQP
jgi:dTDP-4-amino-4,6-dideoxygalactose transaminase